MNKWRHLIEDFFQRLKEFRRAATRCDKTETCLRSTLYLAAIVLGRAGDLAQQGADIARRIVAGPRDELIRAHQHETRRVVSTLVAIGFRTRT
jgi:hypothetical protein